MLVVVRGSLLLGPPRLSEGKWGRFHLPRCLKNSVRPVKRVNPARIPVKSAALNSPTTPTGGALAGGALLVGHLLVGHLLMGHD